MSSLLELTLYALWTKSKRLFLGSYPTKRQIVGGWKDDNEETWKGSASSSNLTDRFVHFLMGGCMWMGYWAKWKGGDKRKYVTTYQHTLAEGSSIPSSCPLNTPPSLDPPVDNLGNRRRWGRRPLRTAGPSLYCRVGFQGPHMALNHTLKEQKKN